MDGFSERRGFAEAAAGGAMLRGFRAVLAGLLSRTPWAGTGWREPSLSALSDRQLRDLGLTRDDVALPQDRMSSADRDILRLLQGLGWR